MALNIKHKHRSLCRRLLTFLIIAKKKPRMDKNKLNVPERYDSFLAEQQTSNK